MRERTMMPIVSADDYLGAAKTAPLSLANVKTDLTKYCRSLYLYVALLSKNAFACVNKPTRTSTVCRERPQLRRNCRLDRSIEYVAEQSGLRPSLYYKKPLL